MVKEQEEPNTPEAPEVEENVAEAAVDPDHQVEAGDPTELQKLIEERDAALAGKADLFDRYQRAQAEFENVRRRMQREQEDAREYAAMGVIEAMLPVADDFERALVAGGLDESVRKGFELIYGRMLDVFQRFGLKPVEDEGIFDPQLHQAVDRAPAEEGEEDQQILEVYRKGYYFKDRLLRPAMVKVAVKD